MTKYKQPSIELVDSVDAKVYAWWVSRPYLKFEDVNRKEIEKMDLPINAFEQYVFKITSSLLFRDLIFSLRPSIAWARSNRTLAFSENSIFISGEYESINDYIVQKTMADIYERLMNGEPQDYAKKKLLMATSTEYMISIDDRSLVAFIKMLKLHNGDLYNVYGKLFLNAIHQSEDYIEARAVDDIYPKLAVSEYERSLIGSFARMGDMISMVVELSNNLMAQFIRQHYSTVKNGLFNKINHTPLKTLMGERSDDVTTVVLYADVNAFKKVVSVRSCAFAQFDQEDNSSWSKIIGPYVEKLDPFEFMDNLPCKGICEKCTIREIMEPSIKCIEVNPPCPILLEDPSLVNLRERIFKSDSRVFRKWKQLAELDMIEDNPENKDRQRYESAKMLKHVMKSIPPEDLFTFPKPILPEIKDDDPYDDKDEDEEQASNGKN